MNVPNIPNDESVKQAAHAYDLVVGQPEAGARTSRAEQSPGVKRDEIALSEEGRLLQRFMKLVQASPDVRMEKVDALQRQIALGAYRVSDEALIDSILSSEAR
ncbi:MAG: flagellar biosynthesis anti-sigma factor FlgM [Chloroflexota bacterium]